MKKLYLSDWKLNACFPYVPFMNKSIETSKELDCIFDWMDARVPGSIHSDLVCAKLIEDPYFEMNSLKCEWVSEYWWIYQTSFRIDEISENLELVAEGLDYNAHIFLNGVKIGEHIGMFSPFVADIKPLVRPGKENHLKILFESAPHEYGQIGYTNKTSTQKSRFNYKWDFCARLINLGIYRPVYIKASGKARVVHWHFQPQYPAKDGRALFFAKTKEAVETVCELQLSKNGRRVYSASLPFCGELKAALAVEDVCLWQPLKPELYDLQAKFYCGGVLSDEIEASVGFKDIRLLPNEGASASALGYAFSVNGNPVYVKGVNIVPVDLLYGSIGKERWDVFFRLIKDAGINLIRVWGGGLIEEEYFYRLCDQNGVMVWQEFIQSSSGLNSEPSCNEAFLGLLRQTAEHAAKYTRNHVSLCVFSGGNELQYDGAVPVGFEHPNIKMLQGIVEEYCPEIPMLPTSASGPHEMASLEWLGENHDVHGPWQYHHDTFYDFYNKIDSLFHSEFGVPGMCCSENMKKFLSPQNILVTDMKDNYVWRWHGEWWDTFNRDVSLFGKFTDVESFSKISQYMQAEGIRYAVEANRRRAFRNSGCIVWQFNEPYPNVSCTSLVDYYYTPKLALKALKKAYAPLNVSARYHALKYAVGEEIAFSLYLSYEESEAEFAVNWSLWDNGEKVVSGAAAVSAGNMRCAVICSDVYRAKTPGTIVLKVCADGAGKHFSDEFAFFVASDGGVCDPKYILENFDRFFAEVPIEK